VFFSGPQQYIGYVEVLRKTYNEGDRAFYDAIKIEKSILAVESIGSSRTDSTLFSYCCFAVNITYL